jgi:hypothetical protein
MNIARHTCKFQFLVVNLALFAFFILIEGGENSKNEQAKEINRTSH